MIAQELPLAVIDAVAIGSFLISREAYSLVIW